MVPGSFRVFQTLLVDQVVQVGVACSKFDNQGRGLRREVPYEFEKDKVRKIASKSFFYEAGRYRV